jgi:hypothetical protein
MLLAAPEALHGGRLPVQLDLEDVVQGGEEKCVVGFRFSLTTELALAIDEVDSLSLALELHLILAVVAHTASPSPVAHCCSACTS